MSGMSRCSECRQVNQEDGDTTGSDTRCRPCRKAAEDSPRIRLSPLARGDLELILAWRSRQDVYRHFREQDGPIEWENHVSWFESRSDDRYDFIVHYAGRRVGVISVDEDDSISIYVGDQSARGRGVASEALRWLCRRFQERIPLSAEIHEDNETSMRLFERCGFRQVGSDDTWLVYAYES